MQATKPKTIVLPLLLAMAAVSFTGLPLFAVEPGAAGAAAGAAPAAPSGPGGTAATPTPAHPANPSAEGQAAAPTAVPADPAAVAASESDWPCVQVKMQSIDAAAVWDGPALDNQTDWGRDDQISKLVAMAMSRRLKVEDVEKAIEGYAKGLPEGERDAKLTKLFAGVLSQANVQRNSIIGGIERYQKRQRQNAKEIEHQGQEIAKLEENAPEDVTKSTPELDLAREKYDWFTRVFQERQSNIPIACELPTLIEQRVFAIARSVRAQMKS